MKYIIGLGNPGDSYTYTRHNIGFIVLDYIKDTYRFTDWVFDKYAQAHVSTGTLNEVSYTLMKPKTFMNLSGLTLDYVLKKTVPIELIYILHDELAYPFKTVKLAYGRGSGGHNGVKSLFTSTTDPFLRFRIGIHSYIPDSEPKILIDLSKISRANFVLQEFRSDEKLEFRAIAEHIVDIVNYIDDFGLSKAMTHYNA